MEQPTQPPDTTTLKIVTRGHGRNRCVRVLHGDQVIKQYRVLRSETNEEAVARVTSQFAEDPRCRGIVDTSMPFDDVLTALLLDEAEDYGKE